MFLGNQLRNKIEFTKDEQDFLIELLMKNQFKKIVEVGVARGGVSKIIMDHLSPNSKLFSIDLSSDFSVGEICKKQYEYDDRWKLYTGSYVFEVVEDIGGDIDLVILDTDHELPGEILDFLMIYPFLRKNSTILVHDILLYWLKPKSEKQSIAPRLLFNTLIGEKKYPSGISQSNLGCVTVNKNLQDISLLIQCLKIPWENFEILNKSKEVKNFFLKYYGDEFDLTNMVLKNIEKIKQ